MRRRAYCEYIMTIRNSNTTSGECKTRTSPTRIFPFSIKKMSNSGCLLDFAKLTDVSKNVISKMSAAQVYENLTAWAGTYDPAFAEVLWADPAYAKAILSIGRGGKKPRKGPCDVGGREAVYGLFLRPLLCHRRRVSRRL